MLLLRGDRHEPRIVEGQTRHQRLIIRRRYIAEVVFKARVISRLEVRCNKVNVWFHFH